MKHFVALFVIIFFCLQRKQNLQRESGSVTTRICVTVCLCERKCVYVCVCVPAHHQGLDQDVFDKFKVIALELLALGAGSLYFLVRVETEELRLVFELALLHD